MTDQAASTEPSRILVVEDDGLIGLRLERLLTDLGYQVTEAVPTGEAALRSVEQHPPDLVLMDVNLAGEMDGIEAAARIQARLDVPIIYLTAYAERMAMEEIKHTQPYGFLAKPVRSEELGATVEVALYKHRMEAKLRESEERYRLLAENVEDVIWQVNERLDGYTYISPSVTRLLGYTPEEMMAMPIEAHLSPLSRSQAQEAIERRRTAEEERRGDGDTPHVWETECVRKDGTTVWVESTTRPLRDEDGTFRGLVGVTRDITERKRAEEALRESEERFRAVFETARDSMFIKDRHLKYVAVNPAMERLFGRTGSELVGHTDEDLFGEEAAAHIREIDTRVLAGEIVEEEDTKPIRPGEPRTFHVIKVPMHDAAGQIVGLCGIARDITERKRAEEELRESEERFRTISHLVSDYAYALTVEPEGTLTPQWVTPQFSSDTGQEIGDRVVDAQHNQHIHPDDVPILERRMERMLSNREDVSEYRILTADGEVRHLRDYGRPVWDDEEGRVVEIVGAAQDITARKQVEEALHTRLRYEKNLALISKALLDSSSPGEDVGSALDHLREAAGVARVYIFENFTDDQGRLCMRQTHESCAPGVQPQIDNLELKHLPYAEGFEGWADTLSGGEPIRGQVAEFPPEEQAILASQGIRSILVLPLHIQRQWQGFIGFDETRFVREWHDDDVRLLQTAAEMIGNYMERKRAEETLRESEERFRGVFETSPTGIAIVDTDTQRFLEANASYLHILGYTLEELQHLTVMDVTHPEDWERESELIQSYLSESLPHYAIEKRYIRQDGEVRWVRTTGDVLFFDPDTPPLAIANVEDITARKRAEEALQALTAQFESFLENAPALIAMFDHEGRYHLVNQATADVINLPQDQIVGRTFADLLPEEAAATFMERVHTLMETDATLSVDDRLWVGGEERVYQTILFPIQGRPNLFGSVAIDVTGRVQAEQALRQYAERLQILHEIDAAILAARSPEAVAHATLEHLHALIPYQRASVSEVDLARQRARDVVVLAAGKAVETTSAWQPLSKAGNVVETAQRGQTYRVQDLATLETSSLLERYLDNIGMRAYVSAPMIAQDELVGTLNLAMGRPDFFRPDHVEILEEIAASLAVAMQQASLLAQTQRDAEAKTLLLREVNHRVMNNLHMILAMLKLEMRQAPAPGEGERDLRTVLQDVCGRIQGIAIVHRMLSGAKRDSLDPNEITSQIIHAALSGSPIRPQIAVAMEAPDDLPRIPSKQAVTLALILNELTTNSVKYAFAGRSRGEIRVRIEELGADEGEGKVRLVFRDDGPGWPEDVLAGERRSMGLWLIQTSATRTLRGEIAWYNDGGAVVEIQFPIRPAL